MKKIILVVAIVAMVGVGFKYIIDDNRRVEKEVYALLEKSVLTSDEKEFVDNMTDPDFAKEGFVVLDDKHSEMFKQHFGRNR